MREAGLFWKGGGGQEVKGVRDLKRGPLKVRKGLGRGTGLEVLPLAEPEDIVVPWTFAKCVKFGNFPK